MHLLFLTDNFPPEVNAPASRTHEHCRAWVKCGLRVTVITSAPNFPAGKVYPGYRNRLWQVEEIDGIRVIRVWTYVTANEGFVRRTADYVSFMLTATIAALFVRKVDLIIGTSPQFFTALSARLVSTLKRRPWIFELRDLWPESIKAVGAMSESPLLHWLEWLELALYRHATRIVAVTHAFREDLARRGIPRDKIDVITNGVDLDGFAPRDRDQDLALSLGLEGCFVAGYIGTHGLAHGLRTLLDAAEQLRNEPDGKSIRLMMLGNGAEKGALVAEAGRRGLDNVVFFDSVPKSEVARYWALLDVAIIHLRKTELFTSVIPSKLFECMGMGIPVLHGVAGESAEIVRREEVGEVFESENANALVAALLRMRRDATLRARYAANGPSAARRYDRTQLARNMLNTIQMTGGR